MGGGGMNKDGAKALVQFKQILADARKLDIKKQLISIMVDYLERENVIRPEGEKDG
jgi:hypothetical protein